MVTQTKKIRLALAKCFAFKQSFGWKIALLGTEHEGTTIFRSIGKYVFMFCGNDGCGGNNDGGMIMAC
jgi:hypothetical protein